MSTTPTFSRKPLKLVKKPPNNPFKPHSLHPFMVFPPSILQLLLVKLAELTNPALLYVLYVLDELRLSRTDPLLTAV